MRRWVVGPRPGQMVGRTRGDREWTQDSKPILWHALKVEEGVEFQILALGAR